MPKYKIPYETWEEKDVNLELEIPEKNVWKEFIPKEKGPVSDLNEAVKKAVDNPIKGKSFDELIKEGKKVCFITENQFRQAPSHLILPPLVERAEKAGAEISIVVANGKAPAPMDDEEMKETIGASVFDKGYPLMVNDVGKEENYTYIGVTSHGTPVWILDPVAEADVIVTISTTQANLWGYGGSGMIIPGVAGNETIEINHIMSLSPDCLPGNNEAEMQKDKYEALTMAEVDMGINVIVNNKKEVTYVNAGHPVESHKVAVDEYNKIYKYDLEEVKNKADIVVTGSTAPTDHLFFHSGWAVVNMEPLAKEGGTVLQATPCPGYRDFPGFALMDLMADYVPASEEKHPEALSCFYKREKELWAGCIWYPIYRTMLNRHVSIVTMEKNIGDAKNVGLDAYTDLQEAFDNALKKQGEDAKVAIVPYGRYTVFR